MIIFRNIHKIFSFLWREIQNQPWLFILILVIASLALRLIYLGSIQEEIFDEVYFVQFAKNYLSHTSFFDIHPPLGKLIIALGIKIFGDAHWAWRIMPAIFGTLIIPLAYLAGKELVNKKVGLFFSLILTLDGMILVYSRTGLIDIFLSFFILFGFFLIVKFANGRKIIWLVLASLALGLAISVKYIAGLLILVYVVVLIVKLGKKNWWKYLITIVLISTIVYLLFFLFNFAPNKDFFKNVFDWHKQTFGYNLNLSEGHPYGSKWWTWFLLLRPIWLYFKDINGKYVGVDGIGNPLAWWSSIVVIPVLVWGFIKKDKISFIILSGFLVFWIFWAYFTRVLFLYHALPSFLFLALGTAYCLDKLTEQKFGPYLVTLYFAILIALFVFFLPIWIGLPIAPAPFYHRIWLKSWI